jgi:MFS family permease
MIPHKPAAGTQRTTPAANPPEETSIVSKVEVSGAIEIAAIEDSSLLAFYRDMNPPERRTFWACAGGWALDGMDFMIYPLVIGTIITMWKVDAGTAGLAGTVTLLASAVGGWLGGYLADRIGRVKTLQFTILWFSVFSLVCAFVQNFDQLLIARALLGLGFGGEWAAGAVLMGEAIRPQYRGRAVGSVQSGWAVGWGLAVLSQAILFSYLPPEIAWRWMFAIGALPALLVFFLRRYVEEPAIAAATLAKQTASGNRPSLWEIFHGPILKTTILASLMATGCQGGYYAITFWVPRFLTTERKLSIVSSTGYLAALIIGSFIGYLVGAWLADRVGRRNLFLIFSIGAIAVILLYTQLPLTNEVLWLLGFPLGFFASGYFSGVGAFLTELYPTRLRGSGQGFCYNFGRGIGALFPFLVGALSTSTSLGNAIAIFAVAAYGVFFIAAFALPETRGRILHADA